MARPAHHERNQAPTVPPVLTDQFVQGFTNHPDPAMQPTLHLAYLDPHPMPDVIPAALQALQTVDALGRVPGLAVTLVTPQPAGQADPSSVLGRPLSSGARLQHLRDFRRSWWYPKRSNALFYRSAVRWLQDNPVDAILVRNLKLADILLRTPGLPPVFFETHEVFAQTFREQYPFPTWAQGHKLARLVQREQRVYRQACGLIAITSLLLDDVRHAYHSQVPGLVAADGVDLLLAQAAYPAPDTPANPPLFAPPAQPVVLYLGSLHPWKGVDTLVQAMPEVKAATLWIGGGGAERMRHLQGHAEYLGCADRVQLLGAIRPVDRFRCIAQATICVLPLTPTSIGSRYTSPLKLFEYLAMGKALVVGDVPAIREVLTHEQDALLVPVDDPAAMAAAINRLLDDPALAQRLAQAAAARAQDFSWDARAQALYQFMLAQLNQTAP